MFSLYLHGFLSSKDMRVGLTRGSKLSVGKNVSVNRTVTPKTHESTSMHKVVYNV